MRRDDFPGDRQNNNQYIVLTYRKIQDATVETKNITIKQTIKFNIKTNTRTGQKRRTQQDRIKPVISNDRRGKRDKGNNNRKS